MNTGEVIEKIRQTGSPLKRQLLMVALITNLLEQKGKGAPVVIGGCALAYYSREVYFTADIDLAYADREALDIALKDIGFKKQGRYWINEDLKIAIEVPSSVLIGEDSPVEIVEFERGLQCRIIGIEDLIIDRLSACKYWKSEIDCEMVELLVKRYKEELDWTYIEKKAVLPEFDILSELLKLKGRVT
ncbi:MAG TPA: hypothetical protein VEF37_03935 [Thermodesulfovibrionales bacterium]|nr:hypothetical protein [Thermodesulfovibrionales bacterium]